MNFTATEISFVLMGDESLLVQCASIVRERGHAIRAVVTGSKPIADWARGEELTVLPPESLAAGGLEGTAFDWFFSIANLRLIPERVWSKAQRGAVNFHDGPLPRYAGLNAPAWAILAGEKDFAVTWHRLGHGIDDGDILVQTPVAIEEEDTALTLNAKCFEAGMAGFSSLLDQIERNSLEPRPQLVSERTYFSKHKRPPGGATIRFEGGVEDVSRLLRALDFGSGYANPLGLPKLLTRQGAFNVIEGNVETRAPQAPSGTVIKAGADGAHIALEDGILVVSKLSDATGSAVDAANVLATGEQLPKLDPESAQRLDLLTGEIAKHEAKFEERLRLFRDTALAGVRPANSGAKPEASVLDVAWPSLTSKFDGVAGVLGYLHRLNGEEHIGVAFADEALLELARQWPGFVAATVPLSVRPKADVTAATLSQEVTDEITQLKKWRAYSGDLVSRLAGGAAALPSIGVIVTSEPASASLLPMTAVTVVVPEKEGDGRIVYDKTRISDVDAAALARRLSVFLKAFSQSPSSLVAELPVMTDAEIAAAIFEANKTQRDYDQGALVHQLFEAQVRRTPDAVALVCDGAQLTYSELNQRADTIAAALQSAGSGPDCLVGLYMRRSLDLVAGALAILKSGGAYIPLDPAYPADRIGLMIADSRCPIILTTGDLRTEVPGTSARILTIEEAANSGTPAVNASGAKSSNLAYVIYTSGSTGRPKGVMVEHRNVVNFFAGMDDRIPVPTGRQPAWLAVTSLSFDISVLELFWTLTRGFKVVIHTEKPSVVIASKRWRKTSGGSGMDFSLFYWGNDDGAGSQKYQLLLEGARFADTHGFTAVWTPERHFHAFGGPYPNPAVTGAAVAAVTRNLDIRAGSCVLPLHHVARVAEEWAIVDNLSNGRAGIAVAAGWMPEDFLLRPENAPPNNKTAMLDGLETLRRLWRGEAVGFPAPGGKTVNLITQPRPVQKELPVWVTTAGNPDTYREAARHGAHVLTHLLGQSIAEVADKIRIYRETLVECGRNPADFKVTLMLHTLIGRDRDTVRDLARGPMKAYLKSAAALIKQYAWAFPAFKKPQGVTNPNEVDLQSLEEEELDAIIEFAFLRYFDDSGLFGTVEEALERVAQVKAIGVDEIACLIDYGVPRQSVLEALEPLAEVVAAANANASAVVADEDVSIGGLIRRHGVTHLQCTPSMASMILSNDEDRAALANVAYLFIGGEALQGSLLSEINATTGAAVFNMYGPTETTIWSATSAARPTDGVVPLGTPIANTQLYVLDSKLRPLPDGVPGELFIGGDGVTRGYLHREDLTKERFLANPFVAGERMYRTGDLVRRSSGGALEFLGRVDFQVKVRGYRIELGEIESCLNAHPGISEAVVVAREDKPGDVRIVAYLRHAKERVPEDALRAHAGAALPDYMVPSHFVAMDKFPLTPNAKVDRNALPKPGSPVRPAATVIEFVAPKDEVEVRIADAFKRALGIERIGTLDNFFTLGGHSLLAVQVHRELKSSVASNLSITDLYRFPTVAGLATHVLDRGQASKDLGRVAQRAAMRRSAIAARRPAQNS